MHFSLPPPLADEGNDSIVLLLYVDLCSSSFPPLSVNLQTGLAIAITVYTAIELSNISWDPANLPSGNFYSNVTDTKFCALGTQATNFTIGDYTFQVNSISDNNCLFIMILGGCTIGLGIVIGIIQCYTCHLCGFGGILDFAFAVCGTAAWCAAAIVVTNVYNDGKNALNAFVTDFQDEREILMIMCWVEMGLFATIILSSILKCASCCCGGGRKSKE